MKNILIVGASGHGGMVLDCINKKGQYNVLGFIDSFKKKGTKKYGLEVLGTELDLPWLVWRLDIQGVIIAIGNNWTRKIMVDKINTICPLLEMVTVVHPSAIIGMGVKIGKGTVIAPGAIINANSQMGDYCILNTNSSLGHDGIMEDFSSISSGVCTGGNLMLGKYSAISLGANVIENISIGKHSLIGAGSLVIKNVASYSLTYGTPARFIRKRKTGDAYLNGDANCGQSYAVHNETNKKSYVQ
ncbi:acetyltransferase [Zobellia uliginosa]|uniref:acetyltransferase n=1 Tax=Zobellia uliginosa TaxID=143224 RepID=UPI001C077A91|nr:acetyltransferase [Zobellia uliginosa]MBU2948594.1 acetyltransferase [Zobellia uliginosa]